MYQNKENELCEEIYSERIEKTGRPDWVTDELINKTRIVWQPRCKTVLEEVDLIKMIVDTSWIFSTEN